MPGNTMRNIFIPFLTSFCWDVHIVYIVTCSLQMTDVKNIEKLVHIEFAICRINWGK